MTRWYAVASALARPAGDGAEVRAVLTFLAADSAETAERRVASGMVLSDGWRVSSTSCAPLPGGAS